MPLIEFDWHYRYDDEKKRIDEDYDTLIYLGGPPYWSRCTLEEFWNFLRESNRAKMNRVRTVK